MTLPSKKKILSHVILRSALSIVLLVAACMAVYPDTDEERLESADRYLRENNHDAAINIWLDYLSRNPQNRQIKDKLERAYVERQGGNLEINRNMLYTQKNPLPDKKMNIRTRSAGQRIAFFNFTATGEPEKHEYYEYVIPQTVAKNLSATGGYVVRRIQDKFALSGDSVAQVQQIKSAGGVHSADFLISGNVNVTAQKLDINVRIHNTRTGTTSTLQKSSQETGVLLKDTIDELTTGIEGQILSQSAQRVPDSTMAPFLRFYQSMEGLAFGFQGGYAFIKRPWRFRFNDNFYYRTFLQYRFTPYFGVSLNLDFLSTDNYGCYRFNSASMTQWIPTIEVKLFLPLSRYFRFALSLGGGAAFTKIVYRPYNDDDPFAIADANRRSSDPHLSTSASLDFTPGPVLLSLGSSYRHTFIYGRQFQWITLFVSLGYCF